MQLNKKACRRYADPELSMPANHGLLYTEQVSYIVRTAVKLIDHHRTLILYIYDRKQAAEGDFHPLWTMFHGKDDYITLARQQDGTTKWRKAALKHLGNTWSFEKKYAFYSAADRERVTRYFRDGAREGLDALIHAQWAIQERRTKARQRRREEAVAARMKGIHALPRGLKGWLRRSIVPAYFFYDHAKRGAASGVCSVCGSGISLTGVKHNAKGTCPRCGREVTMKSRGRRGQLYDRDTCHVLQRVSDSEAVVRIIKVHCTYEGDGAQLELVENARQFIRLEASGKIKSERYYYSYCHEGLTQWKQGERPMFNRYSYNFEADTCGHVYCGNLDDALRGTPWQYCPIGAFYEHFREPMQMLPFLAAHVEHPRLEHLVKVGFYNLASDMVYSGYNCSLDETQNRTHRILGVAAEDVTFLRELDVEMPTLTAFQTYCQCNLKDRQKLLLWQLEQEAAIEILPALEHMTVHKLLRYLETQYSFLRSRRTRYGMERYSTMRNIVVEYKDYLDMCGKLDYDLTDSFILYPKDLQKAHDKLVHRIKLKADAKTRREFKAAYKKVMNNLDYEQDGMKIIYPASPEEITSEGNALHHCVGTYVDRVAKQECLILFLRQCVDESKPFYTVEVRDGKVVQVRGMRNTVATPEVQAFISNWQSKVLQGHSFENAA